MTHSFAGLSRQAGAVLSRWLPGAPLAQSFLLPLPQAPAWSLHSPVPAAPETAKQSSRYQLGSEPMEATLRLFLAACLLHSSPASDLRLKRGFYEHPRLAPAVCVLIRFSFTFTSTASSRPVTAAASSALPKVHSASKKSPGGFKTSYHHIRFPISPKEKAGDGVEPDSPVIWTLLPFCPCEIFWSALVTTPCSDSTIEINRTDEIGCDPGLGF